jgi:hypothetical protein
MGDKNYIINLVNGIRCMENKKNSRTWRSDKQVEKARTKLIDQSTWLQSKVKLNPTHPIEQIQQDDLNSLSIGNLEMIIEKR